MKKFELVLLVVAMACVAVAAAPSFEKVPAAALKALKGVKGKPFKAGLVFVNGHYLEPPYTVARFGTAVFINNVQVTDQISPWKAFLATQEGGAPAAAPKPAASAKPAKAADDLFDEDAPAPDKKADAPAPAEPEPTVAFVPNAQSSKLLKKVNDFRSLTDRTLRGNNILFFGVRYSRVKVTPRLAAQLLEVLPEEMSEANDGPALAAAMRAKGFPFMSKELCADLIANRKDYLLLIERRKKLKDDAELLQMIENGATGGRAR